MPKGMKGYENQPDGGYTYPKGEAKGKPVTMHGGRGVMADGKVSAGQKYPGANSGSSKLASSGRSTNA